MTKVRGAFSAEVTLEGDLRREEGLPGSGQAEQAPSQRWERARQGQHGGPDGCSLMGKGEQRRRRARTARPGPAGCSEKLTFCSRSHGKPQMLEARARLKVWAPGLRGQPELKYGVFLRGNIFKEVR